MFLLMVRRSFARGWKSKLLAAATIALGVSMTAAMLNIALGVGGKMAEELRSYGANLTVIPKTPKVLPGTADLDYDPLARTSFLAEKDLKKIKQIFWRNNIVGFTPVLNGRGEIDRREVPLVGVWFDKQLTLATGETFKAGIKSTKPWVKIKGRHPIDDTAEALVGQRVAGRLDLKVSDKLKVKVAGEELNLRVAGIMTSGDRLDEEILLPLKLLQEKMGLAGRINEAEVSALTIPENELAEKYQRNPKSLTNDEWETWYCTPYIDAIAFQIEEVIPGSTVKPIRQVAQSEGSILQKIQLLMSLLALAALISTALAISSLMTAMALERGREIGLSKALGATGLLVVSSFLAEAALLGLIGGAVGYGLGVAFTRIVSEAVFGSAVSSQALVLPLTLLVSLLVALGGSLPALRAIARLDPIEALHG